MVKRKADKSLEEWLGESGAIPTRNQVGTVAPEEEQNLPLPLSAEVGQSAFAPTAEVGQFAPSLAAEVVQPAPSPTIEVTQPEAPAVVVATPLPDVATTEADAFAWFWDLLE